MPYNDKFFASITDDALYFRNYAGRSDRWRRYIRYLSADYYTPDALSADDRSIVNLLSARVRSIPPKLAIGIPSFKITPVFTSPEPNSGALLAACMSWLWESEQMGKVTRDVTLDAALIGRGIGFCGYETYWGDLEGGKFDRVAKMRAPMDVISSMTGFIRSLFKSGERDERLDRYNDDAIEAMKLIVAERAFLGRVSPLKFLIDPTGVTFDDCAYMGRELYLTSEAGKEMFGDKCPKADSIVNVGLSESGSDERKVDIEDRQLATNLSEYSKRIHVYEMWHMPSQKTVYLDHDRKMLDKGDWKSAFEGWPFVDMTWDSVPDSIAPEGLGCQIEPLQKELNLLRTRQLSESKKAIRKFLVDDTISDDELGALSSEVDGEFVKRAEGSSGIDAITMTYFPPEFWTLEDRIKSDINEMSQTSEYDAGTGPDIRRTATESAFIQSTSNAMMSFRQTMVEEFVNGVVQRTLATVTSVFDKPLVLTINNEDPDLVRSVESEDGGTVMESVGIGESVEAPFIGIDHAGMWRNRVEPGTLVAQAKDIERQTILGIAEAFATDQFVDREQLYRWALGSIPGIKDVDRFVIKPEVAPPAPTASGAVAGADAAGLTGPQMPMIPPGMGIPAPAAPPISPSEGAGEILTQGDLTAATMGAIAPMTG
jgi:hypothetical protein